MVLQIAAWIETICTFISYAIGIGRYELIVVSISEVMMILTTLILTIKYKNNQ